MAVNKTDAPLIIYNNIILGEPVNLEVEINPVYSDTGTNELKYVEHTLTVHTYISGETTQNTFLANPDGFLTPTGLPDYAAGRTDDVMTLIKGSLMVPGRTFYLCNSGYGNLCIRGDELGGATLTEADLERIAGQNFETVGEFNALYRQSDINFGPKPHVLKWEPIGGRNAARVVWEIKIYAQECLLWAEAGIPYWNSLGRILEFNFSQEWSLDRQFLTTRTVSGKVTISNNLLRRNSFTGTLGTGIPATNDNLYKFISENAESLRDTILMRFAAPPYMRRTKQTFIENENNTELKFTIVDEEINSQEYLPAHCIDIEMSQDSSSDIPFANWTSTLSGTITLNAGVPYTRALVIFGTLALQRFVHAPGNVVFEIPIKGSDSQDGKARYERASTQIPLNVRFGEKLFTDSSKFDFSFSWASIITHLSPNDAPDNAAPDLYWWERLGLYSTNIVNGGGAIMLEGFFNWYNYEASFEQIGRLAAFDKYEPRGQANLSYDSKIVTNPCNDLTWSTFAYDAAVQFGMSWDDKSPPPVARPFEKDAKPAIESGKKPALDEGSNPDNSQGYTFFQSLFSPSHLLGQLGYSILKQKQTTSLQTSYANTMTYSRVGDWNKPPSHNDSAYNQGDSREHMFVSKPSSQGAFDGAGSSSRTIERGTPIITATIKGEVVRAGGPHPGPRVTKIGGAVAQLLHENYDYEELDSCESSSIYRSNYTQTYLVMGQPDNAAYLEGQGLIVGAVDRIS